MKDLLKNHFLINDFFIQQKQIDISKTNYNKKLIYIFLNDLDTSTNNTIKKVTYYNNNHYKFQKINLIKNNTFILLLFSFTIINLINNILTKKIFNYKHLSKSNIIKLTLVGDEYQQIINKNYLPNYIYLNDNEVEIDREGNIYINNSINKNYITMVWNKAFVNCNNLFEQHNNIIEIDLSNFDTSKVTNMDFMFYELFGLKYINFGNINTSSVTSMSHMFYACKSLTSIDLSNFDTSNVINMDNMFYGCMSLTSLDLTSFNTSKVKTMEKMFSLLRMINVINLSKINTSNVINMKYLFDDCTLLSSLNLSNFNTSKVLFMEGMFKQCKALTSLDLSSFNTSSVLIMRYMFQYDHQLMYLDLSGFDVNNVYDMSNMFYECKSLLSLDLSSFVFNQAILDFIFSNCFSLTSIKFSKKIKLVDSAVNMFENCLLLKEIDLYNFDFELTKEMKNMFFGCNRLTSILFVSEIETFSVTNMESMFEGCNSLISLNLEKWITSSVTNIQSMFADCTSLIYLNLNNFDTSLVENMQRLFYNCMKLTSINLNNFDTSKVTKMISMFNGCNSLLSLNLFHFNTSKVTSMKYMFFRNEKLTSLDLSSFNTENVTDFSFMFSECSNLSYINFYNFNDKSLNNINYMIFKNPDNIIICINNIMEESNKIKFKNELSRLKCPLIDCSNNWKENKKRIIYNNETCIDNCLNDTIYKYEYQYFCYDKCPKGTHSLKYNKFLCEKNLDECKKKYPYINTKNYSCLEYCNSEEFFNKKCILNNHSIEQKENHTKNIINEIENNSINNLLTEVIKENKDIIIKDNYTLYQLTSSFLQNIGKYQNISSIKLGECEKILKEQYDINNEDTLIIFKIEENIEGFLIPLIEYEIFEPNTKEKLNLSYCREEGININIYIPLFINEDTLYKYDKNDSYYNDICSTSTSEYGTDITLYDRKNEYNNNNTFLCPNNCIFINYSPINFTLICQCEAKEGIFFNISNLINTFIIEKSYINLDVLKCVRLLFSKEGFFKNIANYLILLIIILYIILTINFILKGYKIIFHQINEMINFKRNEIISNDLTKEEHSKAKLPNNINHKKNLKNKNKRNIDYSSNSNDICINNDKINKSMKDINIETEGPNFYYDYEINNIISFDKAKKIDNREYSQLYLSLIKFNYIINYIFKANNDYNPIEIKICLFALILALYMFINTLFFNDGMMHRIYEDKGKFNFVYVLPQIIYSNIICSIFSLFLKIFGLSQKNILEIKNQKNKDNLNAKIINVIIILKIKFLSFFLLSFSVLIFLWFYLSCFCALYKNTQKYLFIVILISYSISFIYPFIIFLLASILRILAIKGIGKCLYKFTQIIESI